MNTPAQHDGNALVATEIETELPDRVDVKALAVLNRSELEVQIETAHKYRRSITRFLQEAESLATLDEEIAESCIYSLFRRDKEGKEITISGPSVRLAEICASAYGNMFYGARILGEEEREVIAQGASYDLEKNVRVTVETRRRITTKAGKRFSDDMVIVTANAAASIALRNAIFRVIPRAYVNRIYQRAKLLSVGDAQSLVTRRDAFFGKLAKAGVSKERVLSRLGKAGLLDVGLEELEILVGLGTAIKQGEMSLDEAFPEPGAATATSPTTGSTPVPEGRRISMRNRRREAAGAAPPAATTTEPAKEPAQTRGPVVQDMGEIGGQQPPTVAKSAEATPTPSAPVAAAATAARPTSTTPPAPPPVGPGSVLGPMPKEDVLARHASRTPPTDIVHVLSQGEMLCAEIEGTPDTWPAGHAWAYPSDKTRVTCQWCKEALKEVEAEARQTTIPGAR